MSRPPRHEGEPVVFGILGAGGAAGVHAAALARIPGVRLAAVAGGSPNSARARTLAGANDARHAAGLRELIEDESLDAVVLATPHPLHAAEAIAAAEAGLHVIVEKPMALEPAECDAMIAAADRNGVVLSVVSQRRWYAPARRVKLAIEDGRIGRPALATIEVLGWRSADYYAMDAWRGTVEGEGGGVLVNQAVHLLDLATWLLGPAVEVDGWTANVNHPEIDVEDTAVAIVRFAGGALGTIVASNSQRPGLHARLHVHGTSGASVGVETDRGSSFVAGVSLPSEPRNDLWTVPGEEKLPDRWLEEDRATLAGVDVASHHHELQLRDMVEAIQTGRPPAVTGEDGRATVALMAAIANASATGGRVLMSDRATEQLARAGSGPPDAP
jgi:predicted dehydrogenase